MILVLSNPADGHLGLIRDALGARNARYAVLDPAEFPASARLSLAHGSHDGRRWCRRSGEMLPLGDVRSVLYRRPGKPGMLPGADAEQSSNLSVLAGIALDGLWEAMRCRWVPCRPHVLEAARHKLWQLDLAACAGLLTPDTVMTNDPAELLAFAERHPGEIITKSFSPGLPLGGQSTLTPTRVLHSRDLRRIAGLQHELVIVQPRIAKAAELRVTVVGRKVFCARIDHGGTHRAAVDWRTAARELDFRPARLPEVVETSLLRVCATLGLCFATADFIVTPEGDIVFLEINPSGQWGFLGKQAEEIADELARFLDEGPGTPETGQT